MTDALEKFKKEYIDNRPELSTEEVIAAENAIESAWGAALEQGEAVEYWVLFDASGGRKFIKKEVGSGVLAFFDDEFAAKAAKRANPGTDYQKVVYYKAPPSTAEAQAGYSLKERLLGSLLDNIIMAFDSMDNESDNAELHGAIIEAKRIRGEG